MNFGNFQINSLIEQVKSTVFQYSPLETLLVKLTNNDAWGHDTKDLQQLVKMCENNTGFQQNNPYPGSSGGHSSSLAFTMSFLHEKCAHTQTTTWRGIYKSLSLLDYLLKHGSESNITTVMNIVQQLSHLDTYQCIDNGKDTGINVRHKMKTMTEMINNRNVLMSEREKASAQVQKFHGGNARGFNAKGGLSSEDYYKGNQQTNTSNAPFQNSYTDNQPKVNPFKPKEDDDEFGDFHDADGKQSQFNHISNNSRDNSTTFQQDNDDFGDFNAPEENKPQNLFEQPSPKDLIKPVGDKVKFDDDAPAPISFIPVVKKSNSQTNPVDLFNSAPKQAVQQSQQSQPTIDLFSSTLINTASPPKQSTQMNQINDLFNSTSPPLQATEPIKPSSSPQANTQMNPQMKPITTANDDPFANLVDFSSKRHSLFI